MPEQSDHIEELIGRKVKWFDADILNLSDVLRDPIVDYELITNADEGPSRSISNKRFSVRKVLGLLTERSSKLLAAAQSADLNNFELLTIESSRFSRATVNHKDTYIKMAIAFENMHKVLYSEEDSKGKEHEIENIYNILPDDLRATLMNH